MTLYTLTNEDTIRNRQKWRRHLVETARKFVGAFQGLPPFLIAENLQPFIPDELRSLANPIIFRNTRGIKAYGYEATLLPRVCEVYLKARDANSIAEVEGRRLLTDDQKRIAAVCDLLMRGLAQVGIIALVDEATGYQAQREKDELNRILSAYINEELRPWVKRVFPEEFFKQIYRLRGRDSTPGGTNRCCHIPASSF